VAEDLGTGGSLDHHVSEVGRVVEECSGAEGPRTLVTPAVVSDEVGVGKPSGEPREGGGSVESSVDAHHRTGGTTIHFVHREAVHVVRSPETSSGCRVHGVTLTGRGRGN
jgi:hypothetical protein